MAFSDVLINSLGIAKGWEHKIISPPEVIFKTPLHPIPLALRQVLQQEVDKMLQLTEIEESHSPWQIPQF